MQTIVLYDVNYQLYRSLLIVLDLSGPHSMPIKALACFQSVFMKMQILIQILLPLLKQKVIYLHFVLYPAFDLIFFLLIQL